MTEIQRFIEIKQKIGELSNSKIRLEERFKSEKEKLEALLKEITSKGYDPKKLAETREEKEKELKKNLDELEKSVSEITTKLNAIEVPNA